MKKNNLNSKQIQNFPGAIGALYCGISVCMGAFGAHALADTLSEHYMAVFQTSVRYLMWHGLAILLVHVLQMLRVQKSRHMMRTIWFFVCGGFIFSGTLFGLVLLNLPILGAVTPIGGLLLICGWLNLLLVFTLWRD